ncbi:MAG: SGNH/GDSL hydrolase family protein [Methylocystis sp.]
MAHVALLGDSIFDNGAYTKGGPAVIQQLRAKLPPGWRATLAAQDGATTVNVAAQLAKLSRDVDRLALSVGGNDALQHAGILDAPVSNSAQALQLIGNAVSGFEAAYRAALRPCLEVDPRLVVCTVYWGNFDPDFARVARIAIAPFNDAIIRAAVEFGLTVVELRLVCDAPADYANPIEPSSQGGEKISAAILRAMTPDAPKGRSARIIG